MHRSLVIFASLTATGLLLLSAPAEAQRRPAGIDAATQKKPTTKGLTPRNMEAVIHTTPAAQGPQAPKEERPSRRLAIGYHDCAKGCYRRKGGQASARMPLSEFGGSAKAARQ
jgi:hypothetical protein